MLVWAGVSFIHAVPAAFLFSRFLDLSAPWTALLFWALLLVGKRLVQTTARTPDDVSIRRPWSVAKRAGRRFPRLRGLYGILLTIAWAKEARNYLLPVAPLVYWGSLALAAATLLSGWSRRRRLVRSICLAALLGWSGWLVLTMQHLGFAMGYGTMLAMMLLRTRRVLDDWAGFSWVGVVPFVLGFSVLTGAATWRYSPAGTPFDRPRSPGKVEPIIPPERAAWRWRGHPDLTFGVELCGQGNYWVGQAIHPGGGLLVTPSPTGDGSPIRIPSVHRPSNNAVVDCSAGMAYVGDEESREIVAYRIGEWETPEWRVDVGSRPPRMLQLVNGGKHLLYLTDGAFRIGVMDLDRRKVLAADDVFPSHCFFEVLPGQIWSLAWYDERRFPGIGLEVFSISSEGLVRLERGELPWPVDERVRVLDTPAPSWRRLPMFAEGERTSFCAYDTDRRDVWLIEPIPGKLFRVRIETGVIDRTIHLTYGSVYVTYLKAHDVVAVSSYLTGDVSFVSGETGDVLGNLNVGPKAGWMQVTSDGLGILIASARGLFRLEMGPLVAP